MVLTNQPFLNQEDSHFDDLNHLSLMMQIHRGYDIKNITWPDASKVELGKYIPGQSECKGRSECKWRINKRDGECMDDWQIRMAWEDLCQSEQIGSTNSYCKGAGGFVFKKNEDRDNKLYNQNHKFIYQGRIEIHGDETIYNLDASNEPVSESGTRQNSWQMPFGLAFPDITQSDGDRLEFQTILPPSSVIKHVVFGESTIMPSNGVSPVVVAVDVETTVNRPWRLIDELLDSKVRLSVTKEDGKEKDIVLSSISLTKHSGHNNDCTVAKSEWNKGEKAINGLPPCHQKWRLQFEANSKNPANGLACNLDGIYKMFIKATDSYNKRVRELEEFSFKMRAPNVCPAFQKIGEVRVDGTLLGYSSEAQLDNPSAAVPVNSLDTWSIIYFRANVTSDMLGEATIKSTVLKDVLVTPKAANAQDSPKEPVAIFTGGSKTTGGGTVQFKSLTTNCSEKDEVCFQFILHPNVIYASDNQSHKTTVIARLELEYDRSTGRRRLMEEEKVLTAEIHVRHNNSPKVAALSLEDVDFPRPEASSFFIWDSIPQGVLFGAIAVLVALAGYLLYQLRRQSQSKDNVKYNTLEETAVM